MTEEKQPARNDEITQETKAIKEEQNNVNLLNPRAGSLVRIGRRPPKPVVVGPNPTPPATTKWLRPVCFYSESRSHSIMQLGNRAAISLVHFFMSLC
jgi:hypothetical protein